ncbi:MAG: hypothetical protein CVV13_12775 [Gammaproteobacteria bacterium HGW-Gammaproteobacteria-3]|nr:MAG: hypothetical protein CVV13_12775 [Gammaproteobacteria bacterium HGW-Gammaproteobacteria-3]
MAVQTLKPNRLIPIVISAAMLTACATSGKTATVPVLPYGRDLANEQKYYVVKKGDTLYSIGFRSGHGYRKLALWNDIHPPYTVMVGQTIKLFNNPGGIKNTHSSIKTPLKKRSSSQKKTILSGDNKKLLKLNWQWPITGTIVKNFFQSGNKGIDISGYFGQPVKAAEAGKVVYSGAGLIGYGNLLIIKHNAMYLSAYANNSRLLVEEGQVVGKNQVIAKVGKTSAGQPALHFEIRKNGKPVNPVNYLP